MFFSPWIESLRSKFAAHQGGHSHRKPVRRRHRNRAIMAFEILENRTVPAAIDFTGAENFAAGDLPIWALDADFDSDGHADLAVPNVLSDEVSVMLGNGDGTFEAARNFAVGDRPEPIAIGDFDEDGLTDLAIGNSGDDDVSVLLGQGDGTFETVGRFAVGDFPGSLTTGDFNADGHTDLASGNRVSDNISVLLGNGDGTFAAAQYFAAGNAPYVLTTGDFDADGHTDLAAANVLSDDISVLLGNSDGTFGPARNVAVGGAPITVTTGDFDTDGRTDLVVSNRETDDVSVLLGNGDGTFEASRNFAAGDGPVAVSTGDFDADGHTDLATANILSDDVSVLSGNGDGTFAAAENFAAGDGPVWVEPGDFDEDGLPDMAVANAGSDNVSIRLNKTLPAIRAVDFGEDLRSVGIQFNQADLDETLAENLDNYEILAANGDENGDGNFFNDGDEEPVPINAVAYDAALDRVAINLNEALFDDVYRLRVDGDGPAADGTPGITDVEGDFLLGGDFRAERDLRALTLVEDLIADVEDLNLDRGTERSLVGRLIGASELLEQEMTSDRGLVPILQAFIDKANFWFEDGEITADQRDDLIARAELIIAGFTDSGSVL